MILRSRERILVVSPAFESVLVLTQLLLLPSLLIFAEMGLLTFYFGAKAVIEIKMNWMLATGIAGLFTIHVLLVRLHAVQSRLDAVAAKLRRMAVLSCPWGSTAVRDLAWRPACWFIPLVFKQPLFRYEVQQGVVEQIVRRLVADIDRSTKFVYIEGESGQGKTRTVFILLHALLKDPKLSDFANRAFLYDLSSGPEIQAALCRRLDTLHHENALVFVDNLHHIEPESLKVLTQKLLDTPSRNTERLVVLLGQPSYAWRVHPTAEVRLLSVARKNSAYFVLSGVLTKSVSEQLAGRPGGAIWTDAFASESSRMATVPQLHFGQAIAAHGTKQLAHLRDLLHLLEGAHPADATMHKPTLVRFVAIVTALAFFRGSFTVMDFWSASWRVFQDRSQVPRLLSCLMMGLVLRRMARLGFTPRLVAPHAQMVFHEALAEHCKDRLKAENLFASTFNAAIRWRLSNKELDDPLRRWLLFCEVHDVEALERLFDQAMLRGTLVPMVRCLDRNWIAVQHSSSISYQYALLLDQVGRFSESRRVFAHVEAQNRMGSVLADRLQLARIEAEHGPEAEVILDRVIKHGDILNSIAANYWKIHLAAHRGIFRPVELMTLLKQLCEQLSLEEMETSHFFVHCGARIFFDAHRHVYLSGEQIEERLAWLHRQPLETALQRQLPQFNAFAILYRDAHLLAHQILPNLVFFGLRPPSGTFDVEDLEAGTITPSSIVKLAHEAYRRAKDEFALYGDRESLYLQADLLNLDMLTDDSDLQAVRFKLIEYEEFVRNTGFDDIQSYPCFYFFRWHMLQYFRWVERGEQQYALTEANMNFDAAADWIGKGLTFDSASRNAYGLWRWQFFKILLAGFSSGNSEVMIKSLGDSGREAELQGYHRDARLIRSLLSSQSRITPLDVRRIILYFPFVHQ